jgi:multidrug efflux pump subunit AcrB
MFIPGISGELYKQFAVAVAVAMVISAINALSLSPALCTLILRRRGKPRGVMAMLNNWIEASRNGYVRIVTPIARRAVVSLALVGAAVAGIVGVGRIVPSGFLPDEDQGAYFAEVQLPDASSVNRTAAALAEVEKIVASHPAVRTVYSVAGYSLLDGLAQPNRAMLVVSLKPFDERKGRNLSAFAAIRDARSPDSARSPPPTPSPSTCRRSWASAIPQASSSWCRAWPAPIPSHSRPWRAA